LVDGLWRKAPFNPSTVKSAKLITPPLTQRSSPCLGAVLDEINRYAALGLDAEVMHRNCRPFFEHALARSTAVCTTKSWGFTLSLMSGAALKRVKPTRWAKPREDLTATTQVLTLAGRTGAPSALLRIASRAVCTSSRSLGADRRRRSPERRGSARQRLGRRAAYAASRRRARPRAARRPSWRWCGWSQPVNVGPEDLGRRRCDDFDVCADHDHITSDNSAHQAWRKQERAKRKAVVTENLLMAAFEAATAIRDARRVMHLPIDPLLGKILMDVCFKHREWAGNGS
jgi:hypothetical protein